LYSPYAGDSKCIRNTGTRAGFSAAKKIRRWLGQLAAKLVERGILVVQGADFV
jgi:hypothetical protein